MNHPSDDIVNEAYERFNRGDFDGWLEFLDPDVELREEYLAPEVFAELKEEALGLGFLHVEAGPLVRSSYHADEHCA